MTAIEHFTSLEDKYVTQVKETLPQPFLDSVAAQGEQLPACERGLSAPTNCPRHVSIRFRQTFLRSQAIVFSSIFIFHLLAQPLQPLCCLVIGEIGKYGLRALERKGLSCCRRCRMSKWRKPSPQFTYCSGLL